MRIRVSIKLCDGLYKAVLQRRMSRTRQQHDKKKKKGFRAAKTIYVLVLQTQVSTFSVGAVYLIRCWTTEAPSPLARHLEGDMRLN
jgi:hypothetical protein